MSHAEVAASINASINYTCWAVFARADGASGAGPDGFEEQAAEAGVTVRGWYDLSATRADADLMVWFHGSDPVSVQATAADLRRRLGWAATPVWSGLGMHRPAEFNKSHVPAYLTGTAPAEWLCVYPFVRSYEWYLLPEPERRDLLREHGLMGREFPQVISNTVSAFALGDYEWILALEAPQLHDLVDLMRHLRYSGARRHVRLEVPFYTGRRISAEAAEELLR
ncbi:MAG TPA: chlorite dismutase family protein [Propionicimonas sp.]|jgi:chlorite dismutase|nr:chlorite dismutase family protein [Propionicimonas sp.]